MSTLLLRCEGPMQSWGTRSRFGVRDSERAPTKSGIVGILAAAAGRSRDADLADLVAFRMGVRIDRAGMMETDFQTALRVAKASHGPPETAMSWRHFLADASFLVGLEAERGLLESFVAYLNAPMWALYLGRRGYVPSLPLLASSQPIVDLPLSDALRCLWPPPRWGERPAELEVILECLPGEDGELYNDVPVSFTTADRRYRSRRVRTSWLELLKEAPCT